MPDDILKLSDTQTLELRRSDSDAVEVLSTWQPSTKPPPLHWHPNQRERFEVLSGELTVRLGDDEPRVLRQGNVLEVPPRMAHQMWNAGPGDVSATWTVTPALRTEEMFRYIDAGLGVVRKVGLLIKFRDVFRLGSPRK